MFRDGGTITAGNASPLNDGASAVLLGSAAAAGLTGLEPLARVAGRAAYALDPQWFGYRPGRGGEPRAGAGRDRVVRRGRGGAGRTRPSRCRAWSPSTRGWPPVWPAPTSSTPAAGAIAIGHPLGASGGRVVGTLAARMRAEQARWGVAAICIGVGQGLAVVLENPDVS